MRRTWNWVQDVDGGGQERYNQRKCYRIQRKVSYNHPDVTEHRLWKSGVKGDVKIWNRGGVDWCYEDQQKINHEAISYRQVLVNGRYN